MNYGVPLLERASRHRCARGPAGCIPTARIRLQTVECTEYVHPRPGTGFADLLRRGILPERDADLTGIHIAVRSVQWIAWRSSSCSHSVDVMASTRVVGHSTALGLTAAWLLALIGIALVFPILVG